MKSILCLFMLFGWCVHSFSQDLNAAKTAFQNQDYAQAISLYHAYLDQVGQDTLGKGVELAEANNGLGVSMVLTGLYEAAIPYLLKALTLNFSVPNQTNLNLAKAYFQTHQPDKGFICLNNAVDNGFVNLQKLNDKEFDDVRDSTAFSAIKDKIMQRIYPCLNDANYRKFDFWVGDWEVFVNDQKVGDSHITKEDGGCAIHEYYSTKPSPYSGHSINYYNPMDKKWHQNWVGSSGDVTHFVEVSSGNGIMDFMADNLDVSGQIKKTRMTFTYDVGRGTVRQYIQDSRDGGITWTVVFDGEYRVKE